MILDPALGGMLDILTWIDTRSPKPLGWAAAGMAALICTLWDLSRETACASHARGEGLGAT